MERITQNVNNIPVYLYRTKKFKSINIRIVFKNHYTKENATKYSLLTSMLTNTSKKYNTKKKVSNVLDDLYSANIVFSTYPIHRTRITTVNLTIVNQKYLNENLIVKGINLLDEFIFNPNMTDGKFDEKVFEEEKNLLEEDLKRVYDNKNRFAMKQMIKYMCSEEIASVSSNGSLEDLSDITNEDIYETYLDLLNNSEKEVYIIGDIEFEDILKSLNNKLLKKLSQKKLNLETILKENKEILEVKNIVEHAETNQAQLMIGYRTTIGQLDDKFYALRLFVGMFGGSYSSNLTRVIREEHSFAYSIYAALMSKAKIIYINAGLDANNCDETIKLIDIELKKYQNGEIDQDLLNLIKAEMISGLDTIEDNPGSILNSFIDLNIIFKDIKEFNSIDEYCELVKQNINKVTVNDIQEVSNTIKLDTIYRLQKENI